MDNAFAFRHAKRRLLSSVVKNTDDGYISQHLNRPLSLRLSSLLAGARISPDGITVAAFVLSLAGAAFLALPSYLAGLLGGLLVQFSSVVDGCDGEVARLRQIASPRGGWLDTILDRYADLAVVLAITFAYSSSYAGHPGHPGALAWMGGVPFPLRLLHGELRDQGVRAPARQTLPGRFPEPNQTPGPSPVGDFSGSCFRCRVSGYGCAWRSESPLRGRNLGSRLAARAPCPASRTIGTHTRPEKDTRLGGRIDCSSSRLTRHGRSSSAAASSNGRGLKPPVHCAVASWASLGRSSSPTPCHSSLLIRTGLQAHAARRRTMKAGSLSASSWRNHTSGGFRRLRTQLSRAPAKRRAATKTYTGLAGVRRVFAQ